MVAVSIASSKLSFEAIREYAEKIGQHYGIYDGLGAADLDVLLAKLGGSVRFGDGSESLHVDAPGSFTIYLPRLTSSRRDRFTIAHELGHYFLHYLHPAHSGPMSFGRGGRDRAETQANVFAASLLMPAEAFIKAYSDAAGDAFVVARLFDVSPAAVQVRAQVLQLA